MTGNGISGVCQKAKNFCDANVGGWLSVVQPPPPTSESWQLGPPSKKTRFLGLFLAGLCKHYRGLYSALRLQAVAVDVQSCIGRCWRACVKEADDETYREKGHGTCAFSMTQPSQKKALFTPTA